MSKKKKGFDSTDSLIVISSSSGQRYPTFVQQEPGEEWKLLRGWLVTYFTTKAFLCVENFTKFKVNKLKFIQQFIKLLVYQNDFDDFELTSVTYQDKQSMRNKLLESIQRQWEQETPAIIAYCR